MIEFPKRLWFEVVLCASFLNLIHSSVAYSLDSQDQLDLIASTSSESNSASSDVYTINFNNVSIIEFIRFVSKITNLNFVFEENDLQFTVTVVSEEPITSKNVMSALAQVLRVHDLMLLEQENNILIVRGTNVNQIPTIVSSDLPDSKAGNAALVTQVFRIKNANLNSVAGIIRPLTSKGALIEVSNETRQLIVTDITTNVEKIASLLASLDAPHTPLDIETYVVKNIPPQELIQLTQQILTPFTEGNPLIFVPQTETNSIYIVSTPYLIERAMTVMEDLDLPAKELRIGHKKGEYYIYKILNASEEQIEQSLDQMATEIKKMPTPDYDLVDAIQSMLWIKETNSLVFTGTSSAIDNLKTILPTFDVSPNQSKTLLAESRSSFLIYNPQFRNGEDLEDSMSEVAESLKESNLANPSFMATIASMKWVPSNNSLIFTGDPQSLERIDGILKAMDVLNANAGETSNVGAQDFYLYKLQNAQGDAVIHELQQLAEQLPQTSRQNQNIVAAIDKIQWVKSTNSILITGNADTIDRLKTLIAEFDVVSVSKSSFLIYTPVIRTAEEMQVDVATMTQDLEDAGLIDPDLFAALSSMKYVPATQSLVFTGSPETLVKVKEMLQRIDSGGAEGGIQHIGKVTFLIYKIQYVTPDQLMASLKNFALQLQNSKVEDKELLKTINDMRFIKETNSILFIGPTQTLERINTLAQKFDISSLAQAPSPTRPAATFVVYTPKYLSGEELISILCEFENNLQNSGINDPGLFDAINNLKWIEKTTTLLISGDEVSVAKVQDLLLKFDIPNRATGVPAIETISNTNFLVYKLQYHQGSAIRDALKQVGHSLSTKAASGNQPNASQNALMDAINSLQWIQVTNSLLGTGDQDVLIKLKELIQNLDIPLKQVFIEIVMIETTLNDAQNFGLMWGSQVQYMNKTILSTGNFPLVGQNNGTTNTPVQTFSPLLQSITATNTPTAGTKGIQFTNGFDLGVIGDIIMHKGKSFISLGSLVNALQQDTNSTVALNPKIITQDNQQSNIFVGQNVPYTGAVVNTVGQSSQQTTGNIEYRDVGVNLTITPILGDNNIVTLDIVYDVSEVLNSQSGGSSIGGAQLTGLLTSHTHMETRVQVPDQHFVALSGMINDSKSRYRSSIPCLGGLPVVGALFSENDRLANKTNVIIFMKPYIINSYDEYKQITEHEEWVYKDNAVLPVLKEEFDAALDLVKTPENE
jgi:type II secretory pathway component GspD/PulD (secretin)